MATVRLVRAKHAMRGLAVNRVPETVHRASPRMHYESSGYSMHRVQSKTCNAGLAVNRVPETVHRASPRMHYEPCSLQGVAPIPSTDVASSLSDLASSPLRGVAPSRSPWSRIFNPRRFRIPDLLHSSLLELCCQSRCATPWRSAVRLSSTATST